MNTQRLPNGRGLARWWKVLSAIQVVGTVAILAACEIPTEGSRVVGSVAVNAERQSLEVGDSTVLEAVVRDQKGGVLLDRHPRWSVSDTTVAALATQGPKAVLRARVAGSVTVKAELDGKVGRAQLSTVARRASRVEISPATSRLRVGEQTHLTARVLDARDVELPDAQVVWSNHTPGIVALTGDGVITALAEGVARITAAVDDAQGDAVVFVAPVAGPGRLDISPSGGTLTRGQQLSLRAVLTDATGDTVPPDGLTWGVEGGPTLSVEPSTATGYAVATSHQVGRGTIVARLANLEVRVEVTVEDGPPIGSMEMRPATLLAEVDVPVVLGVHAWRPDGSFEEQVGASWVSSDPTVVEVSGVGPRAWLRGLRPGTAQVTAAAGGSMAVSTITVKVAGPVDRVLVSPAEGGAWVGGLLRMRAVALAANGSPLPEQPMAWLVEDTTVATIEADGLLLTKKVGTTRVFARSGGRVGTGEVRVHATPTGTLSLALVPDRGPNGEWRPTVSLGDTVWTDPTGVSHTAHRFITAGTMDISLDSGSGWTQVLVVETLVVGPDGPRVVARTSHRDEGTWGFGAPNPWHFFFQSMIRPGYRFEGRMTEPGRFVVEQNLEGASAGAFLWAFR